MTNPRQTPVFEGYAVVSADGFIADSGGLMPDALKFDADWAYFQAALDRADMTLIGRATHDAAPNVKQRRRLVFSGQAEGVKQDDEHVWRIDPAKVDPMRAIAEIAGRSARLAVVGGRGVFDWVRSGPGFSSFHLSLAREARLGRGRAMFSEASDLKTAIGLLEADGLALERRSWLDEAARLELLVYRRS